MDDTEVYRRLLRMEHYIELDGDQKAQEINDRTEEEFQIEKSNLIREGLMKINKEYDKKILLLGNQSEIDISAIKTKYRNQILQSKKRALAKLVRQVFSRIKADLSCIHRRWSVMQLLIMEALFRLLEREVIIKCREADAAMITKHISFITATYKTHTEDDIVLTVDANYIGDDILPGIVVATKDGKIKVNNTLDNRVDQIIECCTPVLSTIFYGTKKFCTRVP